MTGVQTCALPILAAALGARRATDRNRSARSQASTRPESRGGTPTVPAWPAAGRTPPRRSGVPSGEAPDAVDDVVRDEHPVLVASEIAKLCARLRIEHLALDDVAALGPVHGRAVADVRSGVLPHELKLHV